MNNLTVGVCGASVSNGNLFFSNPDPTQPVRNQGWKAARLYRRPLRGRLPQRERPAVPKPEQIAAAESAGRALASTRHCPRH